MLTLDDDVPDPVTYFFSNFGLNSAFRLSVRLAEAPGAASVACASVGEWHLIGLTIRYARPA
jgi:hypothetical protein